MKHFHSYRFDQERISRIYFQPNPNANRSTDHLIQGSVADKLEVLEDSGKRLKDLEKMIDTRLRVDTYHSGSGGKLRIRDANGNKIGSLSDGDVVNYLGISRKSIDAAGSQRGKEHIWLEIETDSGVRGWVSAEYLRGNITLPKPEPKQPDPVPPVELPREKDIEPPTRKPKTKPKTERKPVLPPTLEPVVPTPPDTPENGDGNLTPKGGKKDAPDVPGTGDDDFSGRKGGSAPDTPGSGDDDFSGRKGGSAPDVPGSGDDDFSGRKGGAAPDTPGSGDDDFSGRKGGAAPDAPGSGDDNISGKKGGAAPDTPTDPDEDLKGSGSGAPGELEPGDKEASEAIKKKITDAIDKAMAEKGIKKEDLADTDPFFYKGDVLWVRLKDGSEKELLPVSITEAEKKLTLGDEDIALRRGEVLKKEELRKNLLKTLFIHFGIEVAEPIDTKEWTEQYQYVLDQIRELKKESDFVDVTVGVKEAGKFLVTIDGADASIDPVVVQQEGGKWKFEVGALRTTDLRKALLLANAMYRLSVVRKEFPKADSQNSFVVDGDTMQFNGEASWGFFENGPGWLFPFNGNGELMSDDEIEFYKEQGISPEELAYSFNAWNADKYEDVSGLPEGTPAKIDLNGDMVKDQTALDRVNEELGSSYALYVAKNPTGADYTVKFKDGSSFDVPVKVDGAGFSVMGESFSTFDQALTAAAMLAVSQRTLKDDRDSYPKPKKGSENEPVIVNEDSVEFLSDEDFLLGFGGKKEPDILGKSEMDLLTAAGITVARFAKRVFVPWYKTV